jgi:hypothetical protein
MKKLHVLLGALAFGLVTQIAPVSAAPSGLSSFSNTHATTATQVHYRRYRHHHRRYYRSRGPGISLYFGSGRRGYRHRHHHRHHGW